MSKFEPPDWINPEAWEEFEEHRKSDAKLRKGWSDLARRKCCNKLKGLTFEEQQECIDNSIMSGWSGLFPKPPKKSTQLPGNVGEWHSFCVNHGVKPPRPGESEWQAKQRIETELSRSH